MDVRPDREIGSEDPMDKTERTEKYLIEKIQQAFSHGKGLDLRVDEVRTLLELIHKSLPAKRQTLS